MDNPLFSYSAKLLQAKAHLENLERELVAFLQPDCYELVTETHIEEQTEHFMRGVTRRSVIFRKEIPSLAWGVLIGDFIYNLRSALDHVIFAISYSRNPAEFGHDRTTEFPITDSRVLFDRVRRRGWNSHHEIRGLPPEAQAFVERLQPYRNSLGLRDDPLWQLREMSNLDKHRSIHVTAWNAVALAWDITSMPPGFVLHSLIVRPPGPVDDGTVVAEMRFTMNPPVQAGVYMNKTFFFTVAFGEDTPLVGRHVQATLDGLQDYVEGIVGTPAQYIKF